MRRILVTGSDGYIGAVLINKLLEKGYEVTGLDTLFFKNSILGNYNPKYRLIKSDVRQIQNINLSKFDAVIHLAALSNDPMGEIDTVLTEEINYKATIDLAKKAKKEGIKRFIYSSSCSLYGVSKQEIVNENSKVNPLTAYAKSKVDSENELKKIADEKFCVCLPRNSTVFGYSPKFRDDLVVNNLITSAVALKKIFVKSDGTPWRPLIDVRDLANIFIDFLNIDSYLVNGQVINIGFNDSNYQVNDILKIIKEQVPLCAVIYTGEHGADTRSYRVSFDKFVSLFPSTKQEWPLQRSARDLIDKLEKLMFSEKDLNPNNYNRIEVLKRLISDEKIDKKLFWIH
ncbi:hypothetical protein A3H81_01630 [Candidatus Daviesbacteria bacterium RIFCSPLOWO2_02_FULL_38_18]|uniref:UDP-Glucose 4-empimerase n=1 Tax=Candidatus Daviesbacteria bacterium GW2011_GWF2_38_6 TaxID=1618432 RepID=A0A0G0NMP9_9BACT|nr:MAG: UDP-Glucose 4-empimerase [Candidatus Daviesbacteria bacterium GW2011_GWF2_38_6]OGE67931.1 MAG: hypothetical protein A3H81_01630 [Candidatus Daviesbacteria bacterium RIFCSPLOWO2_02_FULL_38_18]OGE73344.1 MAG: hypothetical protein A3H18_04770 [Candidatus Daviesbacteria bacterium RIFCSPLOWO2_12_FULL_38_10]